MKNMGKIDMNEIVEKMPFLRTECRNNSFIRQVMYRIQLGGDIYTLLDDTLKMYVELQEALHNVYLKNGNKTINEIFEEGKKGLEQKNII